MGPNRATAVSRIAGGIYLQAFENARARRESAYRWFVTGSLQQNVKAADRCRAHGRVSEVGSGHSGRVNTTGAVRVPEAMAGAIVRPHTRPGARRTVHERATHRMIADGAVRGAMPTRPEMPRSDQSSTFAGRTGSVLPQGINGTVEMEFFGLPSMILSL